VGVVFGSVFVSVGEAQKSKSAEVQSSFFSSNLSFFLGIGVLDFSVGSSSHFLFLHGESGVA
jgi:hypothetical protein